jgi:hypothetical protein
MIWASALASVSRELAIRTAMLWEADCGMLLSYPWGVCTAIVHPSAFGVEVGRARGG